MNNCFRLNTNMGVSFTFQLRLILLIASVIISVTAYAEPKNEEENGLQYALEKIQTRYQAVSNPPSKRISISDLDTLKIPIDTLQKELAACISTNTTTLEQVNKNKELLGKKQGTEDIEIQKKRIELTSQSNDLNKILKNCSLLTIQLDELAQSVGNLRDELLKKQLFGREKSLMTAIKQTTSFNEVTLERELDVLQPLIARFYFKNPWAFLWLSIAGLLAGYLWCRYGSCSLLSQHQQRYTSSTLAAMIRGINKTMPILFIVIFTGIYSILQHPSSPLLLPFIKITLLFFLMFAVIRGVLFPERALLSDSATRRSLTLSWILLFFTLLFYMFNDESMGRYSNSVILYFIWLGSLLMAILAFIALVSIMMRNLLSKQTFSIFYLIPIATVVVAMIAAPLGYRNMSALLFLGTLYSLIVLVLAFLALRSSSEIFDSLDEGKVSWTKKLRTTMRIEPEHAFPGIIWLRILFFFSITFLVINSLLSIWGSSQQPLSSMLLSLKDGITIGNTTLDVMNIVYAILLLVMVLSILPLIKNQLLPSWLKNSSLSRGAREAMQTLVGYSGVALAILGAMYIAGVNFKNLAIVAGALSVGIGFGLQNIVNNFVSGLILLFERPIRRGDWVVIGTTEGYVKDISIRSTTIQTFGHSDVIVPNSELISNQVTNWMLSDTVGRLNIPIGVAYGSDTSLVVDILETLASNNPDVINNHPDFPIRVFFFGFGESTLNFELRCFVRNVDNRLRTMSAINLGIDREFRKADIEIPFPQRVLHIQGDKEQT